MSIATTAGPCGHCRRCFNELREGGDLRVTSPVVDRLAETKFDSHLADLLPHSFGPLDLDQAVTVPLLSEPRNSLIAFCNPQLVTFHVSHRTRTRRPWKITAVAFNAMLDRALEEANVAYAPYSTSPAGLAFGTYEGNIFSGDLWKTPLSIHH